MRTRSLSFVAALASVCCAQPSIAADLPRRYEQPVSLVQPNWMGFYFGGQTGAILNGRGDRLVVSETVVPSCSRPSGGRGGRTGVAVGEIESQTIFQGLHAGYNWQHGQAVVSVEADVNSLGPIDDVLASVRARVGFGGERMLIYGTAGVAFLEWRGRWCLYRRQRRTRVTAGPAAKVVRAATASVPASSHARAPIAPVSSGVSARRSSSRRRSVLASRRFTTHSTAGAAMIFAASKPSRLCHGEWATDVLFQRLEYAASEQRPLSTRSNPWAGFYVGGHLGALHNPSDRSIESVALANGEPGSRAFAGSMRVVAVAARWRSRACSGTQQSWAAVTSATTGTPKACSSVRKQMRMPARTTATGISGVRGRLGWTNRDYLFYGTAGIAVVRDESFSAIFAENGGPGENGGMVAAAPGGAGGTGGRALAFGADDTRVGFVIGAGLEAQLSKRVRCGPRGSLLRLAGRDKLAFVAR